MIDEATLGRAPSLMVELAARSDVGRQREQQEDAYDAPAQPLTPADYERGVLLIVADGVGGLAGGDIASRLATETTRDVFTRDWSPDTRYALEQAVARANTAVYLRGQEAETGGIGTTIVCCVLRGDQLDVAAVGDSRLYRLRDGALAQLTVDHSWVQAQVTLGALTEEEARNHPKRHILMRSLGARPTVEIDLRRFALADGDRLLLCTDGLYDLVDEAALAQAMTRPPDEACALLVRLANEAGGSDNITVLLAVVGLTGWAAGADEATAAHAVVPAGAPAGAPAGGHAGDLAEEPTAERPVVGRSAGNYE